MARISALPRIPTGEASGNELLPVVKGNRTMAAPVADVVAPAAQPFVDAAQAAAGAAESLVGKPYGSVAAGLADTAVGAYFAVNNGDGTVTIWYHDAGEGGAGVATNPRTMATTDFLRSTQGASSIGSAAGGNMEKVARTVAAMEVNAENFRTAGMTDQQVLEAAFATGQVIAISADYQMTAAIEVPQLLIAGRGGTITGYDGLGFRVYGTIDISGDITISGFDDGTSGTGAENNHSNYATGFARIATGTAVPLIYVGPGVKVRNSRAFITAAGAGSDIIADPSIVVQRLHCEALDTNGVMQVFMMRCVVKRATGNSNYFRNMIGAARSVGGFLFHLDGLGNGHPAYAQQGTQYFSGDKFFNIINRTTTGDSTNGNAYETHAYMLYGAGATVVAPDIENCTGTGFDCEAVYTKSFNVFVFGGRFKNAGTAEGAITCKGVSQFANINGNGKGGIIRIIGPVIEFDIYEFDNNGTMVTLNPRGVTIASPYQAEVDVTVIGARGRDNGNPDGDVRIEGYRNMDSTVPDPNQGVVVRLRSVGSRSNHGVFARGAFWDANISVHASDIATSGGNWATIRMLSVDGRGVSHRNLRLWHHTQMNNANLAGYEVSGIYIDNEHYDFDGVIMNECVWDVIAPGAIQYPLRLDAAGLAAGRTLKNFEVLDWQFKTPVQPDLGNIWSDGIALLGEGSKVDLTFKFQTTDNTTYTAATMRCASGARLRASLEAFAAREGTPTDAIMQPTISGIWYNNAGTMTAIGAVTAAAAIGSAKTSSVSAALNASGLAVRWRVNGDAGEVWNWSVRMRAEVLGA